MSCLWGVRLRNLCRCGIPSRVVLEMRKMGTIVSVCMFMMHRTMSSLVLTLMGVRRSPGDLMILLMESMVSWRTLSRSCTISILVMTIQKGMCRVLQRKICSRVILSTPRFAPTMIIHRSGCEEDKPNIVVLRYFS